MACGVGELTVNGSSSGKCKWSVTLETCSWEWVPREDRDAKRCDEIREFLPISISTLDKYSRHGTVIFHAS